MMTDLMAVYTASGPIWPRSGGQFCDAERASREFSDPNHLNLYQLLGADPLGDSTSQFASLAAMDQAAKVPQNRIIIHQLYIIYIYNVRGRLVLVP